MKKSEPDNKLPTWVHWIAQDSDGIWWGFETEPNQSHCGWYENEIGRYQKLVQDKSEDKTYDGWRTTLRRIQ